MLDRESPLVHPEKASGWSRDAGKRKGRAPSRSLMVAFFEAVKRRLAAAVQNGVW
jgi:hypothetical protein